ncbi:hypothetical protein C8R44DRAFT_780724 [Mycena epipterygia]|nr:hypothetical protein C8R44DRAFT_780724 [Mycena epipterygia]
MTAFTLTLGLTLTLEMGLGFRALQQLSNGSGLKGNGPVVGEIWTIYCLKLVFPSKAPRLRKYFVFCDPTIDLLTKVI